MMVPNRALWSPLGVTWVPVQAPQPDLLSATLYSPDAAFAPADLRAASAGDLALSASLAPRIVDATVVLDPNTAQISIDLLCRVGSVLTAKYR